MKIIINSPFRTVFGNNIFEINGELFKSNKGYVELKADILPTELCIFPSSVNYFGKKSNGLCIVNPVKDDVYMISSKRWCVVLNFILVLFLVGAVGSVSDVYLVSIVFLYVIIYSLLMLYKPKCVYEVDKIC